MIGCGNSLSALTPLISLRRITRSPQICGYSRLILRNNAPRPVSNHLQIPVGQSTAAVYRNLHTQSRKQFSSLSHTHRFQFHPGNQRVNLVIQRVMSNGSPAAKQSYVERVKVVLKEYGAVGVAFHLTMSLTVLGICYVLVDKYVYVAN